MRNPARFAAVGLLVASVSCYDGQKVLQGKVVSYDAAAKVLVLEDELAPNPKLALDTTSAEFGSKPAVGGLVRVAYHDREGRLFAGRVMSLGSQKGDGRK